jgi:hypothetical protein
MHLPSGDINQDTNTLKNLVLDAVETNQELILGGRWIVNKIQIIMPESYDSLVIGGDATIELADQQGDTNWLCPFNIDLANSVGNLIYIKDGIVFDGGRNNQTLQENEALYSQCAAMRLSRNRYRDPNNQCNLGEFRVDNIRVKNTLSIGYSLAPSSDFKWVEKVTINDGWLEEQGYYQRGHIEYGSSIRNVEINNVKGDIDSYIQTENEVQVETQYSVFNDCEVGVLQFGGHDIKENVTLNNCRTLKALDLNSGTYTIRNGVFKALRNLAWYRSNIDMQDSVILFADDAYLNMYNTLSGAEDIQLNRIFNRNKFLYLNKDENWEAATGTQMIKLTQTADTRLHTAFFHENEFDKRAYCNIRCIGAGMYAINNKLSGERAILCGEFSIYGGDTYIHSTGDDQKNVKGVPIFVNADVDTAHFRLIVTGDGWKTGIGGGQSNIEEHAVYVSTRVFNREREPDCGGIRGDIWNANGKTWIAKNTSRTKDGTEWMLT